MCPAFHDEYQQLSQEETLFSDFCTVGVCNLLDQNMVLVSSTCPSVGLSEGVSWLFLWVCGLVVVCPG